MLTITETTIRDGVTFGEIGSFTPEDRIIKIGENYQIRSGSLIYFGVTIGDNLITGHNILIRENVKIGDNVLIGTNVVIDGNCIIGNHVRIQTGVYITAFTTIKDEVFMGPCSVTTNHKSMLYGDRQNLKGPIILEGARIGGNVTILPGITIGKNAIVGGGSVVTKDVKEGTTVVGNPAEIIRYIKE